MDDIKYIQLHLNKWKKKIYIFNSPANIKCTNIKNIFDMF